MPCGVYADIRILNNERLRSTKKLIACKNRIERWLSIYFPEYKSVFKNIEAPSSLLVLEKAYLPADVVTMGENDINALWREAKLKAVGIKKATRLVDAAKNSIGQTCESKATRMQLLLQEYKNQQEIDARIMA